MKNQILTIESRHHHNGENYIFAGQPTLPFKKVGKFWLIGWDIPTKFAIDANNGCWIDNAHGGRLHLCDTEELIGSCQDESDRNDLRQILGMERLKPSWETIALANGWTPPKDWGIKK